MCGQFPLLSNLMGNKRISYIQITKGKVNYRIIQLIINHCGYTLITKPIDSPPKYPNELISKLKKWIFCTSWSKDLVR